MLSTSVNHTSTGCQGYLVGVGMGASSDNDKTKAELIVELEKARREILSLRHQFDLRQEFDRQSLRDTLSPGFLDDAADRSEE